MGQPAPFPQGPFILASILRCPVVLILPCASR
jgi:predicted LPLAT superfamily acyltransferase